MTGEYESVPLDLDDYVTRSRTGPCFVCEVVRGATPSEHPVVYRDDKVIAFLNRYPTLVGYVLVAPLEHREAVVNDFAPDEYLHLQSVIYRVGRAISAVVETERLYVLSLGSNQGNAHVHWHLAPLPPGVPYHQQQFGALMTESTGGYLAIPAARQAELARAIAAQVGP